MPSRHIQFYGLWLIPLLLGMFAFGLHGANQDSMWFDEVGTLFNAGGVSYDGLPLEQPVSLREVWHIIREFDPIHPPGFYGLLWVWCQFTGWTAFTARALSSVFGLLTVALMARLGQQIIGRGAGNLVAWLFGTAAFMAHYLHEIRMYTLLPMLVALCLWSYWQVMGRARPRWGFAALFVVSVAGLMYTHILAATVLLALALYHLLFARKTIVWGWVVGLVIVSAVLYLPWLPTLWQLVAGTGGGTPRDGAFSTAKILWDGLAIFSNSLLQRPTDWITSFVPIAALLSLLAAGSRWRGRAFIATLLGVTSLLILLIHLQTAMFIHIRYLIVLFPVVILWLGAGLYGLSQRMSARAATALQVAVIALWVVAGWSHYSTFEAFYNRDSQWTLAWEEMLPMLAEVVQPQDTVIVLAAGSRSWWDYARAQTYYLHELPAHLTVTPLRPYPSFAVYAQQFDEQLPNGGRVLAVRDTSQAANVQADFIRAMAERGYVGCLSTSVGRITLEIYNLGNCS